MKKTVRLNKLFALLLSFVLVLALMPQVVLAAEGDVIVDESTFPDPFFRAWVQKNLATFVDPYYILEETTIENTNELYIQDN